jgi:hypothetical protein
MPPSSVRQAPAAARKPFSSTRSARSPRPSGPAGGKAEHEILFQQYFKSVGPRTYAAQVKRANNGNHYLVLTEGKRDDATGDVRKTRLFVFGEDFTEFFKMLQAAAVFIRANPVPDDVKRKRNKFWSRKENRPSNWTPDAARPARDATTGEPPRPEHAGS